MDPMTDCCGTPQNDRPRRTPRRSPVSVCLSGFITSALLVMMQGCGWVDSTGNDGSGSTPTNILPAVADRRVDLLEEKVGILDLQPESADDTASHAFNLTSWEVTETGPLAECRDSFLLEEAAPSLQQACSLAEFACQLFISPDTSADAPTTHQRLLLYPPRLGLPVGVRMRFHFEAEPDNAAGAATTIAQAAANTNATALLQRMDPVTAYEDVAFCIDAANEAPQAVDDEFTVAFGGSLAVVGADTSTQCHPTSNLTQTSTHLISNDVDDSDQRAGCLTAELLTLPAHAANDFAASFTAGGGFVYQPDPSADSRRDRFTYRLNDGALTSEPATVTLIVSNDAGLPLALADTYSVETGSSRNIFYPLSNDIDPDGLNLRVVAVGQPDRDGSATLRGRDQIIYTPAQNNTGTEMFSYTIENSAGAQQSGLITVEMR